MNDKDNGIISKYGFDVIKTGRCKGAVLLDTKQGYYLLKEFNGTVKHLEFEENLLNRISEFEEIHVDRIVRDLEGNLINEDDGGKRFVVRKWYNASDLDAKNDKQILAAASGLAKLHSIMNKISYGNIYLNEYFNLNQLGELLETEFEKHNKELKRARNFIRSKRRKNEFELMVLKDFERFMQDAQYVSEMIDEMEIRQFIRETVERGRLIHGTYNYHNVMLSGDECIITNFERAKCSVQIRDLYDFMRKVMEKHSWDKKLGQRIMEEYNKIRPISEQELKYLALKLRYPEKYWKILNHYYNNNKAWVPDKDVFKLKQVVAQYDIRLDFINSLLNLY